MKIAIISSSLNSTSRSRLLAKIVAANYETLDDVEVDWIDLQDLELPLCDGGAAYGHPNVIELNRRMKDADAYVLASSVYTYDLNAALKNVVELAGRNMEDKLVGFLCAAGGDKSYMSCMAFANSLMLDFRTIILPRFVYATGADWNGDVLKPEIQERVEQFEADFLRLARKLVG